MARPLRIEYPGALYHVTARGNAQQAIYLADNDRKAFLDTLGKALGVCNGLCHAYCLMTNHYHLVIETPDGNLSRIMRQINGVYTQRFNHAHRRVGHVFQGRFKSFLVEREQYLAQLCRYIVLNPVRAGIVDQPEQYRWSSYQTTAGLSKEPDWLTTDWILELFGENRARAQAEYKNFVIAGIDEESPLAESKGQAILGREKFVKQVLQHQEQSKSLTEIPRSERLAHRSPLPVLFEGIDIKDKRSRNAAIRSAYANHGYQQNEIADHLGLHYTTVSNIVRTKTLK